ncbi:MAG: Crp/Fnr family transcriptional regulator [Bacteroidota bacterium]
MISENILKKYRATIIHLNKGKMLFQEGEAAKFFYIVKSGRVKMSNYSEDGREFVQGYFTDGQSFGEPPFFSESPYPASATAVDESEVWKISHEQFLKLLKNNFEIHHDLTRVLCDRLIYKSTMLSELAIEEAEHRLTTLIQYLVTPIDQQAKTPKKLVFTRQQLADMTGLRVETVIRSVKSLEKKRFLEIDKSGKIIWKRLVK